MEVAVRNVRGLPEVGETLLSVRVGGLRKQTPVTGAAHALQFPTLPVNAGSVKLDLLRLLGSSKLSVTPSEQQQYSVVFPLVEASAGAGEDHAGNGRAALDLEVRAAPHLCGENYQSRASPEGATSLNDDGAANGTFDEKKASAAADARAYVAKFGLMGFLQELLQYVIRERPEDPYVFMAAYLTKVTGYKGTEHAAAAAATAAAMATEASPDGPTPPPGPPPPGGVAQEVAPEEAAMLALERQNVCASVSHRGMLASCVFLLHAAASVDR
eukprot:TRINITY_DN70485_c0_g1_i2.p1 TRINITY_DN70485_c0_g1~~TRINITY_DN70485_c0_g1_i2.p1  ORF type:complete len:271 (-),score=74.19 TRINITY_DN70485_c0_g1_i2:41-853(-)